jgi:hypothetical protein
MMLVISVMTRASRITAFLASLALVAAACESRLAPGIGTINQPPVVINAAEYGNMGMIAVNDTLLPRSTTNAGVVYTMISGTFSLHADSTWAASTLESLSSTDGTFIGTHPNNYNGTWSVKDSTVVLSGRGTALVKGDTIFWFNGPRRIWEDSIKYTILKK